MYLEHQSLLGLSAYVTPPARISVENPIIRRRANESRCMAYCGKARRNLRVLSKLGLFSQKLLAAPSRPTSAGQLIHRLRSGSLAPLVDRGQVSVATSPSRDRRRSNHWPRDGSVPRAQIALDRKTATLLAVVRAVRIRSVVGTGVSLVVGVV